jgi:CMP-N,N'-diacetyllegionaminic acid synthase
VDEVRRVCFDIDGVLCDQVEGNYADAKPHDDMIGLVNRLHDAGYVIVLHTSRFMGRAGGDLIEAYRIGFEFTRLQLASWGVRYHELHMGKPRYDVVIDDRSIFYEPNLDAIERRLLARWPLGSDQSA